MTTAVTQAEFARMQGWRKSYVTKLKQEGRLVLDDAGRVLVKESLARIEATRDPNRDDVARRHAERREAAAQVAPTAMDDRAASTYQQSRAVKERYLALQAKAEYEQRIGKLCDADTVRMAGAELGTLLRSSLENLQDMLSAELAPESDPNRIHAMLGEHFEIVLNEISRKLKQTLEREDADG